MDTILDFYRLVGAVVMANGLCGITLYAIIRHKAAKRAGGEAPWYLYFAAALAPLSITLAALSL